ncbi:hypothetical protein BRPE64_ACDS22360 [Caballeronia insecticola]|uniref:Uncharacterized protein n=1 Tax=Caballeronia insecticola TaxID=758793 RepID=R4WSQ7_9BURK|nr:hypothetical protein BRPE64_ACDS22360 [Caballeronia insecticola]
MPARTVARRALPRVQHDRPIRTRIADPGAPMSAPSRL